MKRTISTMICLAAMALAFTACDDETEYKLADTPSVTLSPTSVTLSAEAVESYTINYTVSNPGEGASVSAAADASWVSDISTAVSGQVRFAVAANASDEMRTATLTLTYSYDDGTVTAKAAIVQYGAGDPVLSVDPNAIVASAEGGTYSFGYSVENSAEGESVSCTADADWVTGFVDDGEGTVTFTVAENTGEELRYATITADYDGITDSVSVTQDYDSGEISLVGTYTVTGDDYSGVGTWIMTIHEVTTTSGGPGPGGGTTTTAWYADGLTPTDEGFYVGYGYSYCAKITWTEGEVTFAIASQITNLRSNNLYMGWTPCTSYEDGTYYYSSSYPDLTFTMKNSITWETVDYGVFLGAFSSTSLSRATFSGYFDVVAPTMVITKISSDPDLDTSSIKQASASNAARPLDTLVPYLNFMVK